MGADAFPAALRAAVEASGLGLERIQRRLRERGVEVSIATLSYWQSGRSRPRRESSLHALGELETILKLRPGALADMLTTHDVSSPPLAPIGALAATLGPGVEIPAAFARLDARLHRAIELVSDHITTTVGPDRTHRSHHARRVIRAVADGVDRVILVNRVDDKAAAPPAIVALSHCAVGARDTLPGTSTQLTELLFDRSLDRGESIMVEFQLEYGPPAPRDPFREQYHGLPLRELVMEIQFDVAVAPVQCEWYQRDDVRSLQLTSTRSALVVARDLPATPYGVRWAWS